MISYSGLNNTRQIWMLSYSALKNTIRLLMNYIYDGMITAIQMTSILSVKYTVQLLMHWISNDIGGYMNDNLLGSTINDTVTYGLHLK